MPVIVDTDPGAVTELARALPPGTHAVDGTVALNAWLSHRTDEYVVVLGPGLDLALAIATCESLRLTRPTTSVVLVRHEIDTDVLNRAMQAGCRDVVRASDADGIRAAAARAHQLWQAFSGQGTAGTHGSLITVFAPKGGVGKTTTSVNLALALADGGSRKVCLVDLDLAFGDVAITMQLFPTHTIEEAIGSEEGIDASLAESLLTRHEESLMVLAAPNLPDARDRVTARLVSRMLRTLRQQFDYVVVDTAPNFDEQTLQALDETDECVIIATLDVPTLKNVKVALETLDLLNIAQGHRHLVLNRADDAVGLDNGKVEQILGLPVITPIPSSTDIAAATNAGRPIVLASPDHAASRAFRQLAAHLAEAASDETHPLLQDEADENARGRRWLRRVGA
ncbi:AAA family ATPase [Nocardioides sp.]|uniref:AAA family ATPase n=1 Tax=Nocardioides sp. TaxID=35761 RepID=UPI002C620AE9|nr:AAA family ATPase [Nocardioides sp.]HSX68829.1 AAA family ATPase [Nocardioides sp.]